VYKSLKEQSLQGDLPADKKQVDSQHFAFVFCSCFQFFLHLLSFLFKQKIKEQLEAREKELLPIYHQVAVQFADLHDTAGRMKEKGVIREELRWKEARKYMYWRLRRRLEEEDVIKKVLAVNPTLDRARSLGLISGWFYQDSPGADFETAFKNDKAVVEWLQKYKDIVSSRIHNLEQDYISTLVIREGEKNRTAVVNGLLVLMKNMSQNEREDLAQRILNLSS